MRAAWLVGGAVVAALAFWRREDLSQGVSQVVEKASSAVADLVAQFEGFSADVYQDVAGFWTVGYGHLVKPSDPFHPYGPVTTITREEGAQLLDADTAEAARAVDELVSVPLASNQRAALISFVFNIGRTAFARSTLLSVLNTGDYRRAADELDKWVNAGGVRVAGLVKRRELEKETFLSEVA